MKKYAVYNTFRNEEYNAGSKAGNDAVAIAVKNGYRFIPLYEAEGIHTTISNVVQGMYSTWKLCRELKAGDLVFLQYPVNRYLLGFMYRMFYRKKVHVATLIHDIDFLRNVPFRRKGVQGMRELELSLLSRSEYLICHNSSMADVLKSAGMKSKLISLDLFDYLYDGPEAKRTEDGSLIVAGNLARKKAGYLYCLKGQQFKLSLYGSGLDEAFDNENAEYHGSFPPDELIAGMEGMYGLVWDGPEADTCAGDYGAYLKVNNPHKVSLYLAAGLPVIVWKQSALYPFVTENGVGFGVSSLYETGEAMKTQNYGDMVEHVKKVQKKVRTGWFLTKALQEVEKDIKSVENA